MRHRHELGIVDAEAIVRSREGYRPGALLQSCRVHLCKCGALPWWVEWYCLDNRYVGGGSAEKVIAYWRANGLCLDLADKAEAIMAEAKPCVSW